MHLRLALICRDEAKRLPALAAQLGDRIQSVCILLDDRTVDDTEEVAYQLWGDLPQGGLVEPFQFRDFGQARNLLLEKAREGCDYLLLLDPDSPLIGDLPPELTEPAYECDWALQGVHWPRVILLKSDTPAVFHGAVHEVIVVEAPLTFWSGCHVEARVTAGRERLEWMEGVLRRDAATNPRSAFYLAQTIRDLGRADEAFGWYMRRAAMGEGWIEETFIAVYEAGCLVQRLDWELAETLWKRCLNLRRRAEPCFQLARQANLVGNPSEALAWASLGLRLGSSTDQLFVNRWIEQEGLSEQFNLAAQAMLPQGIQVANPQPQPEAETVPAPAPLP